MPVFVRALNGWPSPHGFLLPCCWVINSRPPPPATGPLCAVCTFCARELPFQWCCCSEVWRSCSNDAVAGFHGPLERRHNGASTNDENEPEPLFSTTPTPPSFLNVQDVKGLPPPRPSPAARVSRPPTSSVWASTPPPPAPRSTCSACTGRRSPTGTVGRPVAGRTQQQQIKGQSCYGGPLPLPMPWIRGKGSEGGSVITLQFRRRYKRRGGRCRAYEGRFTGCSPIRLVVGTLWTYRGGGGASETHLEVRSRLRLGQRVFLVCTERSCVSAV